MLSFRSSVSLSLWWYSLIYFVLFLCLPACTGLEESEDGSCDYFYLLQPPREIPCNPYHPERAADNDVATADTYSVSLECAVALSVKKHEKLGSAAKIRWVKSLGDTRQAQYVRSGQFYNVNTALSSTVGGFVLMQSVLKITGVHSSSGSYSYWCELWSSGNATPNISTDSSVSRVTVQEPDFYASLPPCPTDTAFHLAETACVNGNQPLSDDPTLAMPNSCLSSNGSDSSVAVPLVVVGVALGGGMLVLLAAILVIAVSVLLVRRRHKRKKLNSHSTLSSSSPVVNLEENSVPASALDREENLTLTAAVSDGQPTPSAPRSPVAQQKPCRAVLLPPTHVQQLRVPISARKRAVSLLKQLQSPSSKGAADKTSSSKQRDGKNVAELDDSSTPRKKPYKTLELDTVEEPHLYMTRAKTPAQKASRRGCVIDHHRPVLMNQSQTESREKLMLTESLSNGYVMPGDVEALQQQQEYKEIDPDRQDYLALYTVPRQHNQPTSCKEQPVYEEPRPN